jgi:hypothetical protein
MMSDDPLHEYRKPTFSKMEPDILPEAPKVECQDEQQDKQA